MRKATRHYTHPAGVPKGRIVAKKKSITTKKLRRAHSDLKFSANIARRLRSLGQIAEKAGYDPGVTSDVCDTLKEGLSQLHALLKEKEREMRSGPQPAKEEGFRCPEFERMRAELKARWPEGADTTWIENDL